MGDKVMLDDYPDQDQRAAVCYDAWKNKDKGARLMTPDEFRQRNRLGIDKLPGAVQPRVFRVNVTQPKAVEDGTGSRKIRFCFSDATIDRAGDRIDPNGWVLEDFLKNPVALWAHDSFSPPIGRASRVQVENQRLMGDIEFAAAAAYPFADTIYELTKGGFINAVSVGFMPIKYSFVEDKDRPWGIDFEKQELLEISVCPVPCNPSALVEARAKGIDTRALVEWAERCLDGGGRVVIPKAEFEQLRAAAKPLAGRAGKFRQQFYTLDEARAAEGLTADVLVEAKARMNSKGIRFFEALAEISAEKDAAGASEADPTSGGLLVMGNCGRSKDEECGMKNPAECAIHAEDYEDKKTMSTNVQELVDSAVKQAMTTVAKRMAEQTIKRIEERIRKEGEQPDEGDPADGDREHAKMAKVYVKAAAECHKDAVGLHEDGEHEAAMLMHKAISGMHAKAIEHLEAVPEPSDGEGDGEDKPKPDDPEAKEARRLRARKAVEEARRLRAA